MGAIEPRTEASGRVSPNEGLGSVLLACFPDARDRLRLCAIFASTEFAPRVVRSFRELRAELSQCGARVVLTDADLPEGYSWRNVLTELQPMGDIPLIVVDRLADESRWMAALELGCFDLLGKPFEAAELQRVVTLAGSRAASGARNVAPGWFGV